MVTLEKLGFPTVSGVAKGFVNNFQITAGAVGFPELPFVEESFCYSGSSVELVQKDIDRLIPKIVEKLTIPLNVGTGKISNPIQTQAGYPAPWGTVELGPTTQSTIKFTAKTYEEAFSQFQNRLMDWGWSDALPLIPPTPARVEAMLAATKHKRDEVVVAKFPPGEGIATVEKIAINAVMAGCEPAYFPVVLAATKAMGQAPGIIVTLQSTSPHIPFFWVNGPIIKELGFNYQQGTLGPGSQSKVNIAIGRATRLIAMNIGGAYVGTQDMDTIGWPSKFSAVAAENEDDCAELGWRPYSIQKGFSAKDSTISVYGPSDQADLVGMSSRSGLGILTAAAHDMACVGCLYEGIVFLVSGDDARLMSRDGFKTKESIAEFLAKNIAVDKRTYMAFTNMTEEAYKKRFGDGDIHPIKVEDVHIIRVGADAGKDIFARGLGAQTVSIDEWR
jgi:nitrogen regulatory protein PII